MSVMGVQESLEILKKAQEIDGEIYAIRRELAAIPEILHQLTTEFEQEKSRMAQLDARLKEIQLRQKQKEGELNEKENLIRKYDAQLMQVKTNKEYSALKSEIASLRADGSILEDAILGILDEMDQVQKETREERDRLTQVEKELEAKKIELGERAQTLKADLARLTEKRTGVMAQAPPEARELYEKIVVKKEGLALVAVEGESCGGCRITLRPQVLNEVKLKESLVICDNCSRILYTD